MASREIYFLPVNYTLRKRNRDWYHEQDAARGHVARVTQQRRQRENKPDLEKETHEADIERTLTSDLLDPFVNVCTDLTTEERNLLHDYLINVPGEFYGTGAGSAMCPVRDVTLGILSNSQILLNWALLYAQYRRTVLRLQDPDRDVSVLRQKLRTYKVLNHQVFQQNSVISLDAMYGTAFSALLEHRIGERTMAQKHLQACLTIRELRLKQGLTVSEYPLGTLCIPVTILVGLPRYFKAHDDLKGALQTMKRMFQIFSWRKQFRLKANPAANHTRTPGTLDELQQNLRRHMFDPGIGPSRIWLAIVITLNLASYGLYDNVEENWMSYDNELLRLVAHSLRTALLLSGGCTDNASDDALSPVTPLGLLYTTFMCIDRVEKTSLPRRICSSDLWQAVEVVELLMYTSSGMLMSVKQYLMWWLFDNMTASTVEPNSEPGYLSQLMRQIETTWLGEHKRQDHAMMGTSAKLKMTEVVVKEVGTWAD